MTTKKRGRPKSEPTIRDKQAQAYRNRAAMFRVYEAARAKNYGTIYTAYWTLVDFRQEVNYIE